MKKKNYILIVHNFETISIHHNQIRKSSEAYNNNFNILQSLSMNLESG